MLGTLDYFGPVVMAIELLEDGQAENDNQSDTSPSPPRKKSIEILAIFEKVSLNLRKQNHISGSLNEVLTTR